MKMHWRVVVIAVIICTICSAHSQSCEGEKGDVNNDGSINVLDMLTIANHILGIALLDETGLWRADLNGPEGNCDGDGSANVLDMVKIGNIILGGDACPPASVTDVDGNVYKIMAIGSQVWMAENLRVTHYRNGDPIPEMTDNSQWATLSTGGGCSYDNNASLMTTYGRLYNWYAVDDSRNIAPVGWHVPTDDEWKQLEMYLGMSQSQADAAGWRGTDEGGKMKEAGTSHWSNPNSGATNESGFTALPGGHRYYDGRFLYLGSAASFWSSTEGNWITAWHRSLYVNTSQIRRMSYEKCDGFSVRCLKD